MVFEGGAPEEGFTGVQQMKSGESATVLNTTIEDDALNNGRPTNIPLLVPGQVNTDSLLSGNKPTREQIGIAIEHAKRRISSGESIKSYKSVSEAVKAAESESSERGRRLRR